MCKVVRILIIIATAAGCASPAHDSAHRSSRAAPIPPGWIAIPPYDPTPLDGECINYTRPEWGVALSTDSGMLEIAVTDGSRSVAPVTIDVPGGRLVGFDHGEFGGGVWWVADGASDSVLVDHANLVAFARVGPRVLGFAGIAHLAQDTGYVTEFIERGPGWTSSYVMDLGEAPHALTPWGGDTLLVVTGSTLRLVHVPDLNRVVHRSTAWPHTFPSSIVRDRGGIVYVGMRRAVARLTPRADGYAEDWLVPAQCPRLRTDTTAAECPCDVS